MACKREQIPTLLTESQGIRLHRLFIRFPIETLVVHHDPPVQFHGLNQYRQVILACRHILKDNPVLHSHTVRKNGTHSQRREEPALDRVILQHLRIGDIVFIPIRLVALNHQSHDILDGITMTVECRALQGIAVSHLVFNPLLIQFLKSHAPKASYGGNQPHVLLENLRLFHR